MNKYGTPDICPMCGKPLHHHLAKTADGEQYDEAACSDPRCHYQTKAYEPPQSKDRSPSEPASG